VGRAATVPLPSLRPLPENSMRTLSRENFCSKFVSGLEFKISTEAQPVRIKLQKRGALMPRLDQNQP